MALIAASGMPLIAVGHANLDGNASLGSLLPTILDAANEACIMYGYVWWTDAASHTINTSGSSSLQWRSGTSTFANAGTTVKVGLAPLDTATGPPARSANTADVINYDVSVSYTGGGGGITSNAWQTSVPTVGTKTIATGDLVSFAVQMTARGGSDSVGVSVVPTLTSKSIPCVTSFTGGSYADSQRFPNVVLVASDGTLGFFAGGYVAQTGLAVTTWNNGSNPTEYGNILRFPFPTRAYGIVCGNNVGGNCDFILYSDPLGSAVAQRTVSVDSNTIAETTSTNDGRFLFSTAYDLAANTDYAVVAKPASATNVSMNYKSYFAATHQAAEALGTDCYAVRRLSGVFTTQNSSKDRYAIGLLVGAFDAGGSAGRAVQINNDSLVA